MRRSSQAIAEHCRILLVIAETAFGGRFNPLRDKRRRKLS